MSRWKEGLCKSTALLFEACQKMNAGAAQKALSQGADPHFKDGWGKTPIETAIEAGMSHQGLADEVLWAGAGMALRFIEAVADLEKIGSWGDEVKDSALVLSACAGDEEWIKRLALQGGSLDEALSLALLEAAVPERALDQLWEAGARLSGRTRDERTPRRALETAWAPSEQALSWARKASAREEALDLSETARQGLASASKPRL